MSSLSVPTLLGRMLAMHSLTHFNHLYLSIQYHTISITFIFSSVTYYIDIFLSIFGRSLSCIEQITRSSFQWRMIRFHILFLCWDFFLCFIFISFTWFLSSQILGTYILFHTVCRQWSWWLLPRPIYLWHLRHSNWPILHVILFFFISWCYLSFLDIITYFHLSWERAIELRSPQLIDLDQSY